jgi:hypothetical protein
MMFIDFRIGQKIRMQKTMASSEEWHCLPELDKIDGPRRMSRPLVEAPAEDLIRIKKRS